MATAPGEAVADTPGEAPVRRGWGWKRWTAGTLVSLIALILLALAALNSPPGRRFIIDQIEKLAPANGLQIRIGRIDGSIYGEMEVSDVRLYDPKGLWLEVPKATVDWRPFAFLLSNRLQIETARSDYVILHKLPELIPSEEPEPLLPGFDIHIGDLSIDRLRLAEGIAGEQRDATVAGNIEITDGRAVVNLNAHALGSGERIQLALDAEPDGDVFDLDLQLASPDNGIIATLTGIDKSLTANIAGQGSWSRWEGRATIDTGAAQALRLDLAARDGRYTLAGVVRTGDILEPGLITRLTAPETNLQAAGTFAERRFDGTFSMRSQAAVIEGEGAIDFAGNLFENVSTDIHLLDPSALAEDMRGRDVRLQLRLDGGWQTAAFSYLLTAPQAAFGNTGVENLHVEGAGRITAPPYRLPVSARASLVTGVGETAGGLLHNVRVDGLVLVTDEQIVGEDLRIRSDRLRGNANILYDLATGRYQVALDGEIDRYYVPGLGYVDLSSNVDVRPGRDGRFYITGRARIITRTLENATLAGLTEGLPVINTDFAYDANGLVTFDRTRIRAPGLTFDGRGRINPDGTIFVTGSGSQSQYGAIQITAQGNLSRPHVELALANPLPSAGIANVTAVLDPVSGGYAYTVSGDSMAGPFTSNGNILLPTNAPVSIDIAELMVAETLSQGQLTLAEAGIVGSLSLTGNGIDGTIALNPINGVQGVNVDIAAEDAYIGGEIATNIRQATIDIDALLYPDAPEIYAKVETYGLRRRGLSIARLDAEARLTGGNGHVDVDLAGSRGRDFAFTAGADIAPGMITVNGDGSFAGEPITLTPLRVVSTDQGWRVEESTISYAGGGATVSGLFGGPATQINATLDDIPLSVIDIFLPDTGFGGNITGMIAYDQPAGEVIPTADVELRVRSLTRSGFALRPNPVNLGINARLADHRLAARSIMETGGQEVLRAQVRLESIPDGPSLGEAIASAPMFAEMRYSGPAETLWQLSGNELLGVSGPMVATADAHGTFNNPEYSGSVRTENARLESALTGTVVEDVALDGNFAGSTLTLANISGTTPDGGSVTGNARFDLGLASGLGMNVHLDADRAWLLRRDDIRARVTGPIDIVLQSPPGSVAGTEEALPQGAISGNLELVEGLFALGQAAAAAAVPQLNVTEINRPLDEPQEAAPPIVWTLDFDVAADNRFDVVGLGLDSEWSANLAVNGPLDAFGITGQMDLVRGAYSFAGKRFELSRGRIDFYGNTPINPSLDIVAEGGVEDLQATINIGGNALNPEIRFASVPALPESELLSRLLFGTSITNLSPFEALQLAAAVASLQGGGGGGLNPINAVRDAIGLDRLRIVPADPAEDRGTAVAAGFYVTRRLYAEVISDGQGYSASTLEFQLTRWLALLATISTTGRTGANVQVSKDY